MNDLTIIFLTVNRVPDRWAAYHKEVLLTAAKDIPIISVSEKPIDIGYNIINDGKICYENIYRQMLRAAKLVETPFFAIAEDDSLYHESHFRFQRPEKDAFLYNRNRLSLFTWGEPVYHWRNRINNSVLIAPTRLAIEALEERFARWPNGMPNEIVGELGRRMVDRNMKVTERKSVEGFSKISVIQFNHDYGCEDRQTRHKKTYGSILMYDIPHWGHAANLVKQFI
jgi:hypothetical protein